MNATQQTQQQRLAVIDAWIASKYYPQGLLQTENNTNVLRDIFAKIPNLSVSTIVEAILPLGDIFYGGKLEYAQRAPQVVEKIVEVAPKKSERQLHQEKVAAARLAGVDIEKYDSRQIHSRPHVTTNNEAEQAAKNAKALEAAAQKEAEHIVRKLISEASPIYVGGRLSITRTAEQARKWEAKLVKKQHMSSDGKTFSQSTDWVASIDVVKDLIDPDRKNIRPSRHAQRF